jgi:hypothetical protein
MRQYLTDFIGKESKAGRKEGRNNINEEKGR